MNTKEFLDNVCNEVKYKPASNAISHELEGHIEDLKNDNLCKGYTDKEAEEKAVEQMGDAKEIGKRLNKIHKPKLDWITLIFSLVFIYFGGQFVSLFYLGSYWNNNDNFADWYIYYKCVCIELVIGLILTIFLFFYDYRKIYKHTKILFILATVLNIIAYLRGFRANGNTIYGLWPFASTSPDVFTVPLYIVAFAGLIKDIGDENKVNTTTSSKKRINYNIVKAVMLSCLSVILSLMINFVAGFLLTIIYLIILTEELLKSKEIKKAIMLIAMTIIGFTILSTVICIIPTKQMHKKENYTSSNWVGIDTIGERRIDFVREEIFKSAKLLGQADLENISLKDEQGYYSSIQDWFSPAGKFAFLGILSKYGWIASLGWVLVLIAFNIKLILSARKITDEYGRLIANGIASLFIVQTICNLTMNLGIIGAAEFQLPFISGGKATFISNLLCVSLFLSVYRRKDINFEEPQKSKLVFKIENFFFENVEEFKDEIE